ncbi:MAG TPA: hypothetical protein VFS21_30605 [Roseiflexaceae bacterium]|nr:hypothetical protein [Roseiflexaceae bacterium]
MDHLPLAAELSRLIHIPTRLGPIFANDWEFLAFILAYLLNTYGPPLGIGLVVIGGLGLKFAKRRSERSPRWPKVLIALGAGFLAFIAARIIYSSQHQQRVDAGYLDHQRAKWRSLSVTVYHVPERSDVQTVTLPSLGALQGDARYRSQPSVMLSLFQRDRAAEFRALRRSPARPLASLGKGLVLFAWTEMWQTQRPFAFPARCPVWHITVMQGMRLPCRHVATTDKGHRLYQSVLPDEQQAQGAVLTTVLGGTLIIFDVPRPLEPADIAQVARLVDSMERTMTEDERVAQAELSHASGLRQRCEALKRSGRADC